MARTASSSSRATRWAGPALLVGQGVSTEGAWRDAHGVHPAGAGETLLPPGFEPVAELLVAAGFVARVAADIAAARLAKLLVNVAINPLAALFRVPNGALLQPPHRRDSPSHLAPAGRRPAGVARGVSGKTGL